MNQQQTTDFEMDLNAYLGRLFAYSLCNSFIFGYNNAMALLNDRDVLIDMFNSQMFADKSAFLQERFLSNLTAGAMGRLQTLSLSSCWRCEIE
jgi:hypothetical protein